MTSSGSFDPEAKEQELLAEATSWDISNPAGPEPGDIPTVDVGPYFATGANVDLQLVADTLRHACEEVGFYQLVGHQIPEPLIADTFEWSRRFHDLDLATKQKINLDNPDWPVSTVGYMPVGERRLPRRAKGNLNEAFLLKGDRGVDYGDNQWLPEQDLPGFRAAIEEYGRSVSDLALRLLPVYAVALDLDRDFFAPAFETPFWRLRFTHYPPFAPNEDDEFGIAPHVDTTFFTLLLQDSPGLVIHSAQRDQWIKAPRSENAFVVNSGELLKQWSNDRFLSTRHFANNSVAGQSRYSIPFFFNATADYPMACLPSCHDEQNPPKYPTINYLQSQAVVQGE
ncbi:MAG: 2-oxoglutarate and iron-dependent oxygenase domain-containing protein [Acidimicrobiales bacterium]|nr:2-oxoglutarate and iron-dependent oxygenase domain-containing protein [Acidimicrobiales bacterium]